MESKSSLFIQNNVGLSSETPFKVERNRISSSDSFKTSLNESIIDVFERSEINTAVPNERSGADRRTSPSRRKSQAQSVPFTSGQRNREFDINSTKQTYITAEKNTSSVFSLQKKGSLLDIWA